MTDVLDVVLGDALAGTLTRSIRDLAAAVRRVCTHHNPWKAAAQDLGVDADHALDRVLRLTERAPAAFAEAAATAEVAALERPLPSRLVDLVSERAQRCQLLLRSA